MLNDMIILPKGNFTHAEWKAKKNNDNNDLIASDYEDDSLALC